MPANDIINLIKELNKRIFEQYKDFKGCYLYGSLASETSHKNSDVDLIALFDHIDWEKDFEISGIICELMFKYDIYIDLHIYTLDKLKKNPVFFNEVVNKGLFYEAA